MGETITIRDKLTLLTECAAHPGGVVVKDRAVAGNASILFKNSKTGALLVTCTEHGANFSLRDGTYAVLFTDPRDISGLLATDRAFVECDFWLCKRQFPLT